MKFNIVQQGACVAYISNNFYDVRTFRTNFAIINATSRREMKKPISISKFTKIEHIGHLYIVVQNIEDFPYQTPKNFKLYFPRTPHVT